MRPFDNIRLIDVAVVAVAVLTAVAFWTRNIVAIALLIPSGIALLRYRARTQAEKNRREALAVKSFAISLLLPIIVIMCAVIYFLIKLVPVIIAAWQTG